MFSGYEFTNRSQLDTGITAWIADDAAATATYGDINAWDVSNVHNFTKTL